MRDLASSVVSHAFVDVAFGSIDTGRAMMESSQQQLAEKEPHGSRKLIAKALLMCGCALAAAVVLVSFWI